MSNFCGGLGAPATRSTRMAHRAMLAALILGPECRASTEESTEPLRRRVPSLCGGECRASAEESAEPLRRRVQHRASVHSRNAAFCSGTVLLRSAVESGTFRIG